MINNKCVYYETSRYNYEDAKQKCSERFVNNGRLFEPKSWNENEIAYKIGKSLGDKKWLIGIKFSADPFSIVFESDGTPISYSPKWYSEDWAKCTNCVHFVDGQRTAFWIDNSCSSTYKYSSICEQIAWFNRAYFQMKNIYVSNDVILCWSRINEIYLVKSNYNF